MRRIATSVVSSRAVGARPRALEAVSSSGANRSVANTDSTPFEIDRMRSKPAPVSMFFWGSSSHRPPGPRSYCMNTRFQNSTKRSSPPKRRSAVVAELGALVEEDLRARPARPGLAHPPEVVLVEALDPLGGHADRGRARVSAASSSEMCTVTHSRSGSRPKPSVIEAPRVADGALLEVVAEGEVAHHLEERQVALGRADDVDVRGPKALLDRDRPVEGRGLLAQEVGLEGHHARDGEQQRRVVGDQARRGDDRVAVGRRSSPGRSSEVRRLPRAHSTGGPDSSWSRRGRSGRATASTSARSRP